VSEVGVTSFIDIWRRLKFAVDAAKKVTTVFRRQNSTFRKRFFGKLGYVPVLRSLIRILCASLVQTDTEMTKKFSNERYAVDML